MYYEWSTALDVGVLDVDRQHQGLVALINQLHAHIVEDKIGHEFAAIFAKLKEYTVEHFTDEEMIMAELGMPGLEKHVREHKSFVFFVGMLSASAATFDNETSGYALDFLKNWLNEHILGIDMEIKKYV